MALGFMDSWTYLALSHEINNLHNYYEGQEDEPFEHSRHGSVS